MQIVVRTFHSIISIFIPKSVHDLLSAATNFLRIATVGLRRLQAPTGLYEVLDYTAQLELLDEHGAIAIYTKRQRVRFLQDCATGFYDYGWGDGKSYARHRVHPGRVLDRQAIGSRYRSLILLPAMKRRGEIYSFSVRRRLEDSFRQANDWWMEVEVYHTTRALSLTVLFPAIRPAQQAWITSHREQRRTPVRVDRRLPDGRQKVLYRVHKPTVGECYTLGWNW